MRLEEFKRTMEIPSGIPNDHPSSSEFTKYLKDNGWKCLSFGNYSTVYENPKYPYVMKVNRKYDRGFANFAILTHKFPNKHFPVIGNAKLINMDGLKYHIYLIERLEKLDYQYHDIIDLLAYSIDLFENSKDVIEYVDALIMSNLKYDKFPDLSDEQKKEDKAYRLEKWKRFLISNTGLIDSLLVVKDAKHGSLDIKPSNFMQRKDGTIVITDPVAG